VKAGQSTDPLAHPCRHCRRGVGEGCWNYLGKGKAPCSDRGRFRIRAFLCREVEEAQAFAAEGGQALHLHTIIMDREKAPRCFVAAVDRGEFIAHFFDQNVRRLYATAAGFGVRVLCVERRGEPGQHIDLCGEPLKRALRACENAGEVPARPGLREQPSLFDAEGE